MARHWGAKDYARPNARSKKVMKRKKQHTVFDLEKIEEYNDRGDSTPYGDAVVMYQTFNPADNHERTGQGGVKHQKAEWVHGKGSRTTIGNDDDPSTDLFDDIPYDNCGETRSARNSDAHPWIAERGLLPEGGSITFKVKIGGNEIDVMIMGTYGTHIKDNIASNSAGLEVLPEALFRIRAGINGKAFTKKRWQVLLPAQLMQLGFRQDWVETIWSNLRIEGNPACIAHKTNRTSGRHDFGLTADGKSITCSNTGSAHYEQGQTEHKKSKWEKSIDPACTVEVQDAIIEFIEQCKDQASENYNRQGVIVQGAFETGGFGDIRFSYAKDDDDDYERHVEPLLDSLEAELSKLGPIWEEEIEPEWTKRTSATKKIREEQIALRPSNKKTRDELDEEIAEFNRQKSVEQEALNEKYSKLTAPAREKRETLDTANQSLLDKAQTEITELRKTLDKIRAKYPKARRNARAQKVMHKQEPKEICKVRGLREIMPGGMEEVEFTLYFMNQHDADEYNNHLNIDNHLMWLAEEGDFGRRIPNADDYYSTTAWLTYKWVKEWAPDSDIKIIFFSADAYDDPDLEVFYIE